MTMKPPPRPTTRANALADLLVAVPALASLTLLVLHLFRAIP